MIRNKTIFIAHGWSDVSVNAQSKILALQLAENNKVIFLSSKKSGQSLRVINDNLIVYEWPGKRPVGWKDFFFVIKQMKRYKPYMIITNFAANDIMLFVSWIFRIKYRICYFHTMVEQHIVDHGSINIKQQINIFRKGFVFRMATHMLCPSLAAKKDLIKFYKVKNSRAFVFPNALPNTDLRNETDYKTIGFLGRLDRSKGVDILISSFKKISDRFTDVQLIIAGNGKQENELKEQVFNVGLSDRVVFKGAIAYNHVPDFLASLAFLVVPSRMDNLPTVVLEAFSVGTPVIGSNAGGIPDMINSGYNGFLFENENVEELAQRMEQCLQHQEQRNNISVNARKAFEEKYCIDDLLERFENVIEAHSWRGYGS